MTTYTATISGQGPEAEFETIREARRWAESFGTTADSCTITTSSGRIVGLHMRDTACAGTRWFQANVPEPRWEDVANKGRNPHPIPDFPPRHD